MQIRNVKVVNYTNPIAHGDTCHVTVTFEYMSEEYTTVRLYATIGNNHIFGIFDPIIAAEAIFDLSAKSTWHTATAVAIIPVTTSISDSGIYDIYAKVQEYPRGGWIESPVIVDAIWFGTYQPNDQTLEVDITGSGYVTTSPASLEGKTIWYNGSTGKFPYGTDVEVTAHPYSGQVFEKWSDEVSGGVSYSNPAYVQPMTEHRAVKAHFKGEPEPDQILEVDVTNPNYGYVLTEPASIEGRSEWHHDDTGKFPYGIQVRVTAVPYDGFKFVKWSDEIVGGVSINNPDYVQEMTEKRAVKCHFDHIDSTEPPYEPPEEEPEGPGEGSTSEFPWSWVALGAGALAVIIGITGIKPRNLNSTPHKETRKDR